MQGTGIFSGPIVSSSGQINLAQVSPGTYQILYVFTASNGCSDTAASTLTVSPIPSINIAPEILACPGSTIQLNVSGGTNYSWSPATGLSDPDISNPILTVKSSIVYQVTVTNGTGCAVMDSIKVIVSALGKAAYKVPNAFTPNGDGKNDCFGIEHWGGIDLQEFTIYNRWGQRVFSTKNPSVCWDGTINGAQQESGAFVYIIKANTPCGYIDLKGTVLLIR
jgi:gliding motility-associated-like protein